jgi:hypothetical protein
MRICSICHLPLGVLARGPRCDKCASIVLPPAPGAAAKPQVRVDNRSANRLASLSREVATIGRRGGKTTAVAHIKKLAEQYGLVTTSGVALSARSASSHHSRPSGLVVVTTPPSRAKREADALVDTIARSTPHAGFFQTTSHTARPLTEDYFVDAVRKLRDDYRYASSAWHAYAASIPSPSVSEPPAPATAPDWAAGVSEGQPKSTSTARVVRRAHGKTGRRR